MSLRTSAVLLASALFVSACGGDDNPTGITEGMAVAKFCHQLVLRTGATVDLTLEFGKPAIVRMTARTNTCTPVANTPCTPIPVGLVPLRLMEGTTVLAERSVVLRKDSEYGFRAAVNTVGQVVILGSALNTGSCVMEFLPAPDGGFPDLGPGPGPDGGVTDALASDALRLDTAPVEAGRPADAGAPDVTAPPDVAADVAPPPPDAGTLDAAPADAPAPAEDAAAPDAPADVAVVSD